jgi:hypothetical protein
MSCCWCVVVFSSALQWSPQGSELPEETGCKFTSNQGGRFPQDDPPRAVDQDILLARLKHGQVRAAGKRRGEGGEGEESSIKGFEVERFEAERHTLPLLLRGFEGQQCIVWYNVFHLV